MYQQQPVNEKDWKLFRKKLPKWQEEYMAKSNGGESNLHQNIESE